MSDEIDKQAQPAPRVPWQFSLGGMMRFTVACAAYCGTIRMWIIAMQSGFTSIPAGMAGFVCSIWVCWLVFLALYKSWKLWEAMAIQFSGPVMVVAFACLFAIPQFHDLPISFPAASELLRALLLFITVGMLVSNLFGFPVVAILMLERHQRQNGDGIS